MIMKEEVIQWLIKVGIRELVWIENNRHIPAAYASLMNMRKATGLEPHEILKVLDDLEEAIKMPRDGTVSAAMIAVTTDLTRQLSPKGKSE